MLYKLGSEPLNSWANHCFGNSSSQIVLMSLSSGHPLKQWVDLYFAHYPNLTITMLQPRADLQTIGPALILPTAQVKPQ